MSACISREGEYGEHRLDGAQRFVCADCGTFDEHAALTALANAEGRLATIREFHAQWGDTEANELDQLVLWEDLGHLLAALPAVTP